MSISDWEDHLEMKEAIEQKISDSKKGMIYSKDAPLDPEHLRPFMKALDLADMEEKQLFRWCIRCVGMMFSGAQSAPRQLASQTKEDWRNERVIEIKDWDAQTGIDILKYDEAQQTDFKRRCWQLTMDPTFMSCFLRYDMRNFDPKELRSLPQKYLNLKSRIAEINLL